MKHAPPLPTLFGIMIHTHVIQILVWKYLFVAKTRNGNSYMQYSHMQWI